MVVKHTVVVDAEQKQEAMLSQCSPIVCKLAPFQTRLRPCVRRYPLHIMPDCVPQDRSGMLDSPQGPRTGAGM